MKKMINYYRLAKEELYKVIFPTKDQIRNGFFSVVLVVIFVTIFLGLFDLTFSSILSLVLGQ
jgi:preprotein translocase subunit SecE